MRFYLLFLVMLLLIPLVHANSYLVVIEGNEVLSVKRSISSLQENNYTSDYSLVLLDGEGVMLTEKKVPFIAYGEKKMSCFVDDFLNEFFETDRLITYTYNCEDNFSIPKTSYFLDYHPKAKVLEFRKKEEVLSTYDLDTLTSYCGDGICQPHENWYTCPIDCDGIRISYSDEDRKYLDEGFISSNKGFVIDTVEVCESFLESTFPVSSRNCLARTDEGWNIYALTGETTISSSNSMNINKIVVSEGKLTFLNEELIDDIAMQGSPFGNELLVENGGEFSYTTRRIKDSLELEESSFIIKSNRETGRTTFATTGNFVQEEFIPIFSTRSSNDFNSIPIVGQAYEELRDVQDSIPIGFGTDKIYYSQGNIFLALARGNMLDLPPAFDSIVKSNNNIYVALSLGFGGSR